MGVGGVGREVLGEPGEAHPELLAPTRGEKSREEDPAGEISSKSRDMESEND